MAVEGDLNSRLVSVRRCGICRKAGHNKRTCPTPSQSCQPSRASPSPPPRFAESHALSSVDYEESARQAMPTVAPGAPGAEPARSRRSGRFSRPTAPPGPGTKRVPNPTHPVAQVQLQLEISAPTLQSTRPTRAAAILASALISRSSIAQRPEEDSHQPTSASVFLEHLGSTRPSSAPVSHHPLASEHNSPVSDVTPLDPSPLHTASESDFDFNHCTSRRRRRSARTAPNSRSAVRRSTVSSRANELPISPESPASSPASPLAIPRNHMVDNPQREHLCPFRVYGCRTRTYQGDRALLRHMDKHHSRHVPPDNFAFTRCAICCRHFKPAGGLAHHQAWGPCQPLNILRRRAAPVAADGPEPLEETDFDACYEFFSDGMFKPHHSWVPLLQQITTNLLVSMSSHDNDTCVAASNALLILPGVIKKSQSYAKLPPSLLRPTAIRVNRPVEILRQILGEGNTARAIHVFAHGLLRAYPDSIPPSAREANDNVEAALSRLTRQVEKSCSDGLFSKAATHLYAMEKIITDLDPPSVIRRQLTPAEERTHIARLYPRATDADILDPVSDSVIPLELVVDDILQAAQRIKTDKSKGPSGWTNSLAKRLLTSGNEDTQRAIAVALTAVFNLILAGKMPLATRRYWTAVRVCLIPKSNTDPESLRPLGVGEPLMCFCSSIAVSKCAPTVGALFRVSGQLGVGVSGGVEIAARIADLGYQMNNFPPADVGIGTPRSDNASLPESGPPAEGYATIDCDIANAHNSIPRRIVQDGLVKYCPALLHLHHWQYHAGVSLRNNKNGESGISGTGCTQGEPASNIYFPVSIQDCLLQIAAHRDEYETELGVERKDCGSQIAIQDDFSVTGRTDVIFRVAPLIEQEFEAIGLRLNKAKTVIVGPKVNSSFGLPPGFRCSQYSAKTLGRLIGGLPEQVNFTENYIERIKPPVLALQRISPQNQLALLCRCFNRKPGYLFNISTAHTIESGIFKNHDRNTASALFNILSVADAPTQSRVDKVRDLPLNQGGFGMHLVTGLDQARLRQLCHSRTQEHIDLHIPNLRNVHDYIYSTSLTGAELDLTAAMRRMDGLIPTNTIALAKATSKAVAELHRAQFLAIHRELLGNEETRSLAASLLSAGCSEAGKYVFQPHYRNSENQRATHGAYIAALCDRATIPAFPLGGAGPLYCPCRSSESRNAVDLRRHPEHPRCCHFNQPLVNARHDDIVKTHLAPLLRSAGYTVEIEPVAHGAFHFQEQNVKRPDISYGKNGIVKYLDVVVACPAVMTNRNSALFSSETVPDGASRSAEARKRRDYQNFPAGVIVTPFAVESTGRLGPAAKELLALVCADRPSSLRYFLTDISICLAAHLGNMVAASKRRATWRPIEV